MVIAHFNLHAEHNWLETGAPPTDAHVGRSVKIRPAWTKSRFGPLHRQTAQYNFNNPLTARGLMQKTALLTLAVCASLEMANAQTAFVIQLDSSQEVPPTSSTAT